MVRSIKLVDPLASLLPKMCVSNHPQICFWTKPWLEWYYIWETLLHYYSSKTAISIVQCFFCKSGVIRSTSREKFYQRLGLQSLQLRRWCRTLHCILTIFDCQRRSCLLHIDFTRISSYSTQNNQIPSFKFWHNVLKK